MKLIKLALYCLLVGFVGVGCDTADKEPYVELSMVVRNRNLPLSITDAGGRDITSRALGSRMVSFVGESYHPLYIDLDNRGNTWMLSVPLPNAKRIKGSLKDGDIVSSEFVVASNHNKIKLRCFFRYNDNRKSVVQYGGTGLTALRIEDESGKLVSEAPLELHFKFDIFNYLHLLPQLKPSN